MNVATAHPDQQALAHFGSSVRERLSSSPRRRIPVSQAEIYAIDNFISPRNCTGLIAQIDQVAEPSILLDSLEWPDYRTSYSGDLDPHSPLVFDLEHRISSLIGIDNTYGESAQGQRYGPGQYFHEHCDWFDTNAEYWQNESINGGQRSWTAMIYLNDVAEGGATEFPHLNLAIRPSAGTLVIWNNALPDGSPNPWTLHASRPVIHGMKYVVTKWFRTRPWC